MKQETGELILSEIIKINGLIGEIKTEIGVINGRLDRIESEIVEIKADLISTTSSIRAEMKENFSDMADHVNFISKEILSKMDRHKAHA
jgi:predicted  nucleic acid-binding Zn-ribbon protein